MPWYWQICSRILSWDRGDANTVMSSASLKAWGPACFSLSISERSPRPRCGQVAGWNRGYRMGVSTVVQLHRVASGLRKAQLGQPGRGLLRAPTIERVTGAVTAGWMKWTVLVCYLFIRRKSHTRQETVLSANERNHRPSADFLNTHSTMPVV